MPERSVSVSFRLPAAIAEQLERRASELGLSRGEYARRLVLEGMGDTKSEELRRQVDRLEGEVGKLRGDLKNSVGALLIKAGKANPEEAKRFVAESLNT